MAKSLSSSALNFSATSLTVYSLVCLLINGPFCVSGSGIFALQPISDSEVIISGVLEILESTEVTVNVIGLNLFDGQEIAFTTAEGERGSECRREKSDNFPLSGVKVIDNSSGIHQGKLTFELYETRGDAEWYYVCLESVENSIPESNDRTRSTNSSSEYNGTLTTPKSTKLWLHQGPTVKIKAKSRLLPLWLQIILIGGFLVLSGLFSGLNLGLMSLNPTELKIVQNSGSEKEKQYAKSISPVRKRGNFLLCSLLLGNVLVNSTLTILLDDIGGGVVAVVASTVSIVIFGEIVPQAICSRHGLAVGAKTIWLTKIFMVITLPLAFPLSILLDKILGEELGQVYNREKLAELIKLGADKQDIKHEELNIIEGALQLTKKTAVDVMTPVDDVYMVDYAAILDFETMSEIMHTGYTRVPVFENQRLNIVALLNIKDLAFVDPDDKIPLRTVCKFYNHPITFVFEDTRLDQLLEEFKKGQSHMAFVQTVVTTDQKDPYYDIIGIVTLEDIIEEIIQCEILDETDIITDNQTKRRRHNVRKKDFSMFNTPNASGRCSNMSPQLTLACFQYLQSTVEPFKEEYLSSNMLKRLLKQDIHVQYKYDEKSIDNLLYIASKPADYFIIILQGKCSVEIGRDNLKFEAGPFFSFGAEALLLGASTTELNRHSLPRKTQAAGQDSLTSNSAHNLMEVNYSRNYAYVPDYTVRALDDLEYVKIRRHQYIAAHRATLMERQPTTPRPSDVTVTEEDPFSIEWKRANQLSQHHSEEGTTLPPYLRLHQRNYSSGNLEELRSRADFNKLSPLVRDSQIVDKQPLKTVIYPEKASSEIADPEQIGLLKPRERKISDSSATKQSL